MDLVARVMHAGDVTDVGRPVAAAFAAGDRLPNGSYVDVCGGTYSSGRVPTCCWTFAERRDVLRQGSCRVLRAASYLW